MKKNLQKDPSVKTLLPELADAFAALEVFDQATTEAALRELAEARGVKSGLLINSARTALTGRRSGRECSTWSPPSEKTEPWRD